MPMKEKSWQTDTCFLLGNRKKVAEENQYVCLGFGKRKEEALAGVSVGDEECEVLPCGDGRLEGEWGES